MDDAVSRAGGLVHDLGSVTLGSGLTVPDMRLSYKTHGRLNAERSNAILFPTWFAGQHPANEWIIGPGRSLDSTRYFIIVIDIIGNGRSSSPSNFDAPFAGPDFPLVTVYDNVLLQHRLLAELFGIERLALVIGRSMGAQIAFQWAALFPDRVERLFPFVGSAKTSPHNYAFLENVKMAIFSDPAFAQGRYRSQPSLAFERLQLVFDCWGYSQAFFREGLHLKLGFDSIEAFLARRGALPQADANDLLAQVATWQAADISANSRFGGDIDKALASITARTIVMPCRTDLYFPPEDSMLEVARMPNAQLRVIDSAWGHRAGSPGTDPVDIAFIEQAVRDLLVH